MPFTALWLSIRTLPNDARVARVQRRQRKNPQYEK